MNPGVDHAHATLAGRIGSWRDSAKTNANTVVLLAAQLEAALAEIERVKASRQAEIDAARSRQHTAEQAAAGLAAERDAAVAKAAAIEQRHAHLVGVSRDLAARLSRVPSGGVLLARDSEHVVLKYQRLLAQEV